MNEKNRFSRIFINTAKIAIGTSIAIYIAEHINLQNVSSAGIIALLTIATTKWETIKLSYMRVLTFAITVLVSGILFKFISSTWMAYGLFIFIIASLGEFVGWRASLSVNAVIASHFLISDDYSMGFILNEFLLVVIGIVVAIILNLFHGNNNHKSRIVGYMRDTEESLRVVLGDVSLYLSDQSIEKNVWDDIRSLEKKLRNYIDEAYRYQDNTFHSHPRYYIDYFKMRMEQLNVLHNLHYEMKKIRNMPKQASIISEFIICLMEHIDEENNPIIQLNELNLAFKEMKEEPLPVSMEEFESRAILYHIMMDLEDFLIYKRRFIESLEDKHKKIYWSSSAQNK